MRKFRVPVVLLLILCALPALSAGELLVSAAASLSDALREVAARYEKRTGEHVALNFGSSGALALQIKAGAPADVFFGANDETMDLLVGLRLIDVKTRRVILTNTLAVVVPADSTLVITTPRDLLNPAVRRLALGQPNSVPAGIYAREYLQKLGLWALLSPRVVPTEDVRAALAAVAAGNADAAIVYRTDARSTDKVRVAYEVRATDGPRIVYPAAVLRNAQEPKRARRFVEYLASREARAIFARYGFGLP